MRKIIPMAVAFTAMLFAQGARAQTNLQILYDFAPDRQFVTTTVEGFYNDNWGNTFFFVDHDFNTRDDKNKVYAPSGTYFEIARCLNFWQGTALAPLSLHVEYNGGVYKGYEINSAFLAGLDFFVHSIDFRNTFNFKVLWKGITYTTQKAPLQFTFVWGMQDLFGLKGLRFSGFADFWWEDHIVTSGLGDKFLPDISLSHTVFITEPQLWYNVGRHFGCDNLNIGGEVELSVDFGGTRGFRARPCAGIKWVF